MSRYEKYFYCAHCTKYVLKTDCFDFPPRCPTCKKRVHTYPRSGKYKEHYRKTWLKEYQKLPASTYTPTRNDKLHKARPRFCPSCGGVRKRFYRTRQGWIKICVDCGFKQKV